MTQFKVGDIVRFSDEHLERYVITSRRLLNGWNGLISKDDFCNERLEVRGLEDTPFGRCLLLVSLTGKVHPPDTVRSLAEICFQLAEDRLEIDEALWI